MPLINAYAEETQSLATNVINKLQLARCYQIDLKLFGKLRKLTSKAPNGLQPRKLLHWKEFDRLTRVEGFIIYYYLRLFQVF